MGGYQQSNNMMFLSGQAYYPVMQPAQPQNGNAAVKSYDGGNDPTAGLTYLANIGGPLVAETQMDLPVIIGNYDNFQFNFPSGGTPSSRGSGDSYNGDILGQLMSMNNWLQSFVGPVLQQLSGNATGGSGGGPVGGTNGDGTVASQVSDSEDTATLEARMKYASNDIADQKDKNIPKNDKLALSSCESNVSQSLVDAYMDAFKPNIDQGVLADDMKKCINYDPSCGVYLDLAQLKKMVGAQSESLTDRMKYAAKGQKDTDPNGYIVKNDQLELGSSDDDQSLETAYDAISHSANAMDQGQLLGYIDQCKKSDGNGGAYLDLAQLGKLVASGGASGASGSSGSGDTGRADRVAKWNNNKQQYEDQIRNSKEFYEALQKKMKDDGFDYNQQLLSIKQSISIPPADAQAQIDALNAKRDQYATTVMGDIQDAYINQNTPIPSADINWDDPTFLAKLKATDAYKNLSDAEYNKIFPNGDDAMSPGRAKRLQNLDATVLSEIKTALQNGTLPAGFTAQDIASLF